MDFQRILGEELYERAKQYADKRFGKRKLAMLIRIAVEEYLQRVGGYYGQTVQSKYQNSIKHDIWHPPYCGRLPLLG